MQMYRVSLQTHYEDVIDVGEALVCASDRQGAIDIVVFHFGLAASRTVFDVQRMKPSVFQLDRREIIKHTIARERGLSQKSRFVVSVVAGTRAKDQSSACRAVGHMLIGKAGNPKYSDKNITEFELDVDYAPSHGGGLASPNIDRQAIYKETRIFRGGKADGNA